MTRHPATRSRWRYRDLPIQRKISLIIAIGMASAMFVTVANFISFDRENVKRDLGEEMRVLARITAARSAAAVAFGDRPNARENLSALALRSTVQYACIYDEQQRLFASFDREDTAGSACPQMLEEADEQLKRRRQQLLQVVEPIFRKGLRLGHVLVASDLSPIAERTRKWIVTSVFVTLVALLVAFLMTRRMQRSVVQPIIDLSQVMDRVRGSNNLSLRATARGQDEVGNLVDSFNEMLEIIEKNNRDLEMLYRGLVEKSAEAEATAASLELRNQQIRDLFGSAAHDLRQPLQAMAIFVGALKEHATQAQEPLLQKLEQVVENLNLMFTDLLDISKLESRMTRIPKQQIAIQPLLARIYDEFEALANEKRIELRLYNRDLTVYSNANMLERIIRNMLSNAIRYTRTGGVLIGCRKRANAVWIEVWDTGRGIPQEKLGEIFNEFVQIQEEDSESSKGVGLGLFIVKRLAQLLDHSILVTSQLRRGTMFRIIAPTERAPLAQPLEAPLPPPTTVIQATRLPGKVLLLDDDDTVRLALKQLLKSWGCEVRDWSRLEDAEETLRREPAAIDLIISDFQLDPQRNGLDAIAALRQQLGANTPAMLITGAQEPELIEQIEQSQTPWLRKPVRPAKLRAMMQALGKS